MIKKGRFKPGTCALFVAAFVTISIHTWAEEPMVPPVIEAPSAVLIDAKTGIILYEKEKDQRNYPASVTKLMTALLTLEYIEAAPSSSGQSRLDERVKFSHDAVFSIPRDSSHIAMDEDETLSVREALYAIMLASANEVANAVAEHISGSGAVFAEKMTQRAQALGAKNSHFTNPHGLHDENHYATAYDLALIMKEALKHPLFTDIIATLHADIPPTERQPESRPLDNSDKMIQPYSRYYDEDVVGGKTGFTTEAQHTLATYGERDGIGLIAVVMHDESSAAAYDDTRALLDYGFGQYVTLDVLNKDTYEKRLPVEVVPDTQKSNVEYLNVMADESLELCVPQKAAAYITISDDLPESVTRDVTAGDGIGTLTAFYEDIPLASVHLTALNSVHIETLDAAARNDANDGFSLRSLPFKPFIGVLVIIVCVLFVVMLAAEMKRSRRRSRRYRLRQVNQTSYRYRNR